MKAGMTELSPSALATPSDIRSVRPGSVGLLLPNSTAKIVDPASGRLLGVGEEGELWIRGPHVMKGYRNNPQATAETIDADGYLHTGDIARVDRDGYFYITDRLKELIKYNGHQVAPAELEEHLLSHPAVSDAAVVGVPDEAAGEVRPRGAKAPQVAERAADRARAHAEWRGVPAAADRAGGAQGGRGGRPGRPGRPRRGPRGAAQGRARHVRIAPLRDRRGGRAHALVPPNAGRYLRQRLRGGVRVVPEIPKSPSGKILRRVIRQHLLAGGRSKL